MASVDYHKCHGSDAARLIGHADKSNRQKDSFYEVAGKHDHISKELAATDIELYEGGYEGTMERYRSRIRELDQGGNRNRRKDRVELFALEAPLPLGMDPQAGTDLILDCIRQQYGEKNLVQATTHLDEVGTYLDHGEVKEKRPHVHVFVVPEVDGQLCGAKFSTKKAMQKLNKNIDKTCYERTGIRYMTGDQPRKKSVEDLKMESYKELIAAVEGLQDTITKLEGVKKAFEDEILQLETVAAGVREETPYKVKSRIFSDEKVVQVPLQDYEKLALYVKKVEGLLPAIEGIKKRQQSIDAELQAAQQAKTDALKLKSSIEEKLASGVLEVIKSDMPEAFDRAGGYIRVADRAAYQERIREERQERHKGRGR